MGIFSKQFEVDYISARPDLHTTFARLMEYVQEGSTAHTESTMFPMAWFADNMTGWVITNWCVEVHSYPRYCDIIRVETWPSKFKGILADRSFAIYNQKGDCILSAVSSWIYTDLKKRRPIRPEIEMVKSYGEAHPYNIEKDYVIPSIDLFHKIDEYSFIVRRRDIDTNYHVNNIKYIEWAQDGIPDDVFNNANVVGMKANYKKECSCGDNVAVITFAGNENSLEFFTIIKNITAEGNENILTEIYTKWN